MERSLNIPIVAASVVISIAVAGVWQVLPTSASDLAQKAYAYTEVFTSKGKEHGRADWTHGVITATGIGFPPKDPINPSQSREMTKRAAWGVAVRNLLEALKGVHVDSSTTINNHMVSNDEIEVKVSGMVRGARTVKEQDRPDGSYEVTVEMNLGSQLRNVFPTPAARPVSRIPGPMQEIKATGDYTGLVVDARGIGATTALKPKILNEDGLEAYSTAFVKSQDLLERGIVVYAADIGYARSHRRVTDNPLIVKAVRASGADLVIRNVDAQTLHVVPEHFKFLENAKVLVVLDNR